jgi:pyruvate/2-oxoglutarate dehydrogenase complex dihydrolipoamide acyltransferase (E2) component
MATEVILPKVDMDMATGRISKWLVEEGANVKQGDAIFEIETDKAAMEVEATATGILKNIIGKVGIDQTTPGTTNGVQVNAAIPAGGNTIGNVGLVAGSAKVGQVAIDQTTPGTTNLVALAANQSVNVAQVNGATTSTAASGVQKVGIVGNAGAAVDAANNGTFPANVVAAGYEARDTTTSTAATVGQIKAAVTSLDGVQYVRQGGPVSWSCGLAAQAASLAQCQAAPGAGVSLYITDILAGSNTSTAGTFIVTSGTGTNCGTTNTALLYNTTSAVIGLPANTIAPLSIQFLTPIRVGTNDEICVKGVATNTTNITINGFTAP